MATYEDVDDDVTDKIERLLKNFHLKRLYLDAIKDISIKCLFYYAKRNEKGEITGPPLKLHGYSCYAVVKVNSLKHRAQGLADVGIIIDGDAWKNLGEEERMAILDHELEHLERVIDAAGPVDDDLERPKLTCKLHDWHMGGFRIIAERHKQHAIEVIAMQNFADTHGQLIFGFARAAMDPKKLANDPAIAKAVKNLASCGEKTGTSTTISIPGGPSVTIDDSNRQRIKDNCDAVINGRKKAGAAA
jgi:hypothetical protein